MRTKWGLEVALKFALLKDHTRSPRLCIWVGVYVYCFSCLVYELSSFIQEPVVALEGHLAIESGVRIHQTNLGLAILKY